MVPEQVITPREANWSNGSELATRIFRFVAPANGSRELVLYAMAEDEGKTF